MIKFNGNEVQFETFPNGETKMIEASIVPHIDRLLDNTLHFKYESDADLIKLMFVKRFLDGFRLNLSLLIYYMPYSRMDRSENGSAFTLKYVTEFINGLKFDDVTVIEPHSDVTPALLDNVNTLMVTHALLPMVMERIGFDAQVDYLVFPDAGAQKRYSHIRDLKTLVGNKKRNFETGRIDNLDLVGEIEGLVGASHKALIVDDLSSYGGTFLMAAQALRDRGFDEVYLLVGHAEIAMLHGELVKSSSPINKIFTTDTIMNEMDGAKVKAYAIEGLLA